MVFLVECGLGSYGSNCSLNCSSYCLNKTCDRNSGECLYGCIPGYQKPDCAMRKFYFKISLLCRVGIVCNHNKKTVKHLKRYKFLHQNRLLKKLVVLDICNNEDYGKNENELSNV